MTRDPETSGGNEVGRRLPIAVVVGNPVDKAQADAAYDYLEQVLSPAECYRLKRDVGGLFGAGIGFVAILGTVGSLTSIARFLWMAYREVLARHERESGRKSILYIAIDPNQDLHWSLGERFQDGEAFEQDFRLKVERYLEEEKGSTFAEQVVVEVRHSNHWRRTR